VDALTADGWERLGPAARRAELVALRRRDPASASALLAEKIAGEIPDQRVRLIETLTVGLSETDRPLLETLTSDRAPRVKGLAMSLLARLGDGETEGEDHGELAGFFAVQVKGLLRRTRIVVPQALKTAAQRARRTQLMEVISFNAFARALELTSQELVSAWSWQADELADQQLAAMAARSADDAATEALADALADACIAPRAFAPLMPRLGLEMRRKAASRLLTRGGGFAAVLDIVGGGARIDAAIRSPAGAALLRGLRTEKGSLAEMSAELLALGLIASRPAAKEALEQLATVGLIASDPRLDMLRLNAALEDRGAKE